MLVCGDVDLRDVTTDLHSQPLEVCALVVLYALLEELPDTATTDAISSITGLEIEYIDMLPCLRSAE